MTVADNTSRNQYTATSGQTVFAYTFEIVDKSHIVVLQNGVTLSEGADYAVSDVGNDSGGNVTLTVGASTSDILTLYRDMPHSRTQNYTDSGDFLASEINADFDNLWLAGEQTDRSFSQSIRKPITDSSSISMELPAASSRANKLLGFSATGAVQASSSDLLNVTATSTELNVLDGITASTAELNYVTGVTSGIQAQLNTKSPIASPTFTGTVTIPSLTLGGTAITATGTELNYVDGVTSDIQTQIDAKMPLAGGTFTGAVTFNNNISARFGSSFDLIINSDGTDSFITEQGSGSLFIKSNGAGIVFRNSTGANYVSMLESTGEAKLFHISGGTATQRLATSTLGIDVNGTTETDKLRITTSSAPSSATDTGTVGEIAWDANYIYVCVGTNTWKRVAISTW
jgi:hypothetical protein